MTAGIACDTYKVDKFKEYLDEAGFEYEEVDGVTEGTKTIKVQYSNLKELMDIQDICKTLQHHFKHRN